MSGRGSILRITLVGPATPALLQHHFDEPVVSKGYPFPILPALAEEFHRQGHHVTVVSTATDVTRTLRYRGEGVELTIVPSRQRARERALDLFAAERRHLAAAIAASKPDVIHAHWTYEFALAAHQSRSGPVIVTARDAPLTILRHAPDAYRLIRALMAYQTRIRMRHFTAISPEFAHRWKRQMLYWGPVRVIPNPASVLHLDLSLRSSSPVVLGVGDDSRRKNYRTLLLAFRKVLAESEDAQLRLVGPGLDNGSPLADWARKRGLNQSVTFVGPVDRTILGRELSAATVFCHPSLEESFGNVIVEALSAGLPVVAGRKSGGVPWVLFDGRAGRLVNVRSPRGIADGILTAIRSPSSNVAEGFDLAAELRRRYSPESVAEQYLEEYRRLITATTNRRDA